MTDREEKAFRDALQDLVTDDEAVPGMTRRPRSVMPMVLAAAAILVLVSVIGLPRLLGGTAGGSAADSGGVSAAAESAPVPREMAPPSAAPSDPAPAGWRTEHFRDISFQVPAGWGYAVPPQSDWCADDPEGEPRPDQRRPYVWLRMDIPVRSIGCPEPRPDSLITEHVEAIAPGPAEDYAPGATRNGEWWVVSRFVGSAILVVTSKDRALADRILDSAQVADESAPCPAASPVAGPVGTRPATATPLDEVSSVDWIAVCQYEPVLDQVDVTLPRLRAVSVRQGTAAEDLVEQLRSSPVLETSCDPAPVDGRPDLAILVRIATSDGVREVHVAATGCPSGESGMAGGIDDGTAVRVLTRPACQDLLLPPLLLLSASGEVGTNCLG